MNDKILQLGDPVLRDMAETVHWEHPEELQEIAESLGRALRSFREQHGFGRALAAPQLGHSVRMLALALDGWPGIIVNPQITWRSDDQVSLWDDCMCFPSLLVRVQRRASISLRYHDLDGVQFLREHLPVDLAELFQHEIDHLDGVLSTDRAVGTDPIISREVFDAQPDIFLAQVNYHTGLGSTGQADLSARPEPVAQISRRFIDPHTYPPGIAYMEGQYLPVSEARVSALDFGFIRSDATYDVVHVRDGRFFRLDRHLQRFFAGMDKLHLNPGRTPHDIQNILCNCVALSGLRDAYVEMICTRGMSPEFSRDPRQAQNRFLAFVLPFISVASEAQLEKGMHLAIGSSIRIPAESVDPQIKNYHWLDLVRGLFDAFERDADSAILLDTQGYLTEGPGFNIFIINDGRVKTPARGVLAGITRETVFDLCAESEIHAVAGDITVDELMICDEAFITSTAGGIMPVTRIAGQALGDGQVGGLTRQLMDQYWKKHQHPDWTTPIQYPGSI